MMHFQTFYFHKYELKYTIMDFLLLIFALVKVKVLDLELCYNYRFQQLKNVSVLRWLLKAMNIE